MTATVAPPAQKIEVENPATGQIVASVDVVGPERIGELPTDGRDRPQQEARIERLATSS